MAVVEGVAVSHKTIQMRTTYVPILRQPIPSDVNLNCFHETLLLLQRQPGADLISQTEAIFAWITKMKQEM